MKPWHIFDFHILGLATGEEQTDPDQDRDSGGKYAKGTFFGPGRHS